MTKPLAIVTFSSALFNYHDAENRLIQVTLPPSLCMCA